MSVKSNASNRIVVGVDGSPASEVALKWAADEARHRGVGLHVVTCWEFPVIPWAAYAPLISGDELKSGARELAEKEVANVIGTSDLSVSIEVTEGSPSLRLLDFADSAEMIVVGSRGRGGFAGLLLGSVSQHLAEHARCPVVIVNAEKS